MWLFKKIVPPKALTYSTTSLQVGDECICIDDRPHDNSHQKLLILKQTYTVRYVGLGNNKNGFGGPFIRLKGITPINDMSWSCDRFEKVSKKLEKDSILTQVLEPTDLNVKKEKQLADELWKSK